MAPANPGAPSAARSTQRKPIRLQPTFVRLAVPNHDAAVVSLPSDRATHEPVLVAAHGAGNTPEELCATWRDLLGARGVVLCPAGPKMDAHAEGRYFPDHFALERLVFDSLDALAAAYPSAIDGRDVIYTGYSQGATMGALMIVSHGDRCPRLVLMEGGYRDWSVARARAFANSGGKRVFIACGTKSCTEQATAAVGWLERAGIDARVVATPAGHTYEGAVADAVRANFDWLIRDDPRWTQRSAPQAR